MTSQLDATRRGVRTGAQRAIRPLTREEYERIAGLAYRAFGLDLRNGKELMVSSRLMPQVRSLNCKSFGEYHRRVIEDPTGDLLNEMADALTTNFTGFWREAAHFEFLHDNISELRKRESLRVWSAAAATGEEPYSIAICLLESLSEEVPFSILATDISGRALRTASKGIYSSQRLESLSPQLIAKYFLRGEGAWAGSCQVRSELRRLVRFHRLNLIEPLPDVGTFSVIFCRNVLIYFDITTQLSTVNDLVKHLEPGGYLIIGHAESLIAFNCPLEYVRPGIYRKSPRAKRLGYPS
jgi:chemotaxis protein methyltransferase CheR